MAEKKKTVYAVAPAKGAHSYITAGKRYEARDMIGGVGFKFWADNGSSCVGLWQDCAHLNGGNWTRVEE